MAVLSSLTRMGERVVESGMRIQWEPNAPSAVMVSDDAGRTALALRAHPDDPDQRHLVLLWRRVEFAALSAPNDEAISGHPLWREDGLGEVRWLGLVEGSRRVRTLADQNAAHPSHDPRRYEFLDHYIAPLKECIAEVVAGSVETHRHEGCNPGCCRRGSDCGRALTAACADVAGPCHGIDHDQRIPAFRSMNSELASRPSRGSGGGSRF